MTNADVDGSTVNGNMNGSDMVNSQNPTETNQGPSDQAKALIERIPDLTFMLSSTLSISSSKSNKE
jgi:hypothetical protein